MISGSRESCRMEAGTSLTCNPSYSPCVGHQILLLGPSVAVQFHQWQAASWWSLGSLQIEDTCRGLQRRPGVWPGFRRRVVDALLRLNEHQCRLLIRVICYESLLYCVLTWQELEPTASPDTAGVAFWPGTA